MKSKYQLKENSFYYTNTDIPKNKFDIKESQIIQDIEQELLIKSYEMFFDELEEDTIFDEEYFKSLHKRTFESLYDWAGVYRDFNMAKGESRFCQGAFNGYRFIDYSTITPKQYIDSAIDCVQYTDETGFEKIILNGLIKT